MEDKQLKKLTVSIENEEKEDIVIIFADPSVKDLKAVITEECVLTTVNNILFIKKEEIEVKSVISQEIFLEVHKDNTSLKTEKILEDFNCYGEGDIQENVKGQINWKKDEGIRPLLNNGEIDSLTKVNVISYEDSGNYDNVGDRNISIDDNLKENKGKTTEKFEVELDINYKIETDLNEENPVEDTDTKKGKFESDINGKKLSNPSIFHKQPFSCDICETTYIFKSQYTEHLRYHTGEKPYVCDVCGKSCYTKGNLNKHKAFHTGIKLHACKLCDKKYHIKNHLTRHEKTHQSDRPKFKCAICKKELILSHTTSLKNHMKLHAGVKPHVCDFCGKAFTEKFGLVGHLRNHTGEKPYSCDLCDKSFSLSSSLKKHKSMHTGNKSFSCEVCNKKFFTKTMLERHLRVHTGEKPYSCEHCGKSFAFPSNLKRHKKTHAGLEPKQPVNDLL